MISVRFLPALPSPPVQQGDFSGHALPWAWNGAFLPEVHQASAAPADGCPASERLPADEKAARTSAPVPGSGMQNPRIIKE